MKFRSIAGLAAGVAVVLSGSVSSAQDDPVVVMETSLGTITVELAPAEAPISVDNFLQYVDAGHYDNTIFHRVIQGFMIQGGAYSPEMRTRPTRPPIENEAQNGLLNDRYTVAMARTSEIHSATDQFFINTVDNNFLNNGVRDFRLRGVRSGDRRHRRRGPHRRGAGLEHGAERGGGDSVRTAAVSRTPPAAGPRRPRPGPVARPATPRARGSDAGCPCGRGRFGAHADCPEAAQRGSSRAVRSASLATAPGAGAVGRVEHHA